MKLITLACALFMLPVFCTAQETENVKKNVDNGKVFFGISSGIDYYQNAYQQTPTADYSFEDKGPRYNINLEAAYMVTDRLRPRIQFGFHRQAYRQNWLSAATSSSSSMKYTDTHLNYLDINLMADYLLIGLNSKFQTFISTGIVTEYNTYHSFNTTKNDGETTSTAFKEIGTHYPKCSAGWQSSLIFKYKVSDFIGITLSPGYNRYFRNYDEDNSGTYQRFNLNLGVEIGIN
ncbi:MULTISPECIES: hypothetical protein [unclassified Saccharicrinis]|uniref:hypothetical protein n=1 Tax=unclassified Saccharicrinis TaxID=2646859 RepID=UPI003D356A5A